MPLKKKGKGKKKKKGGAAKKKNTVPAGTSAAACKKILRLYQQKTDLSHSVSFRSLTQELSKCVEEDRPLEKIILESQEVLPLAAVGGSKPRPPTGTQSASAVRKSKDGEAVGPTDPLPVEKLEPELRSSIQPLLDSLQESKYKQVVQLSMLEMSLSNADAASLAIFLETECAAALKTLELVRAGVGDWAMPRLVGPLGKCVLTTLVLDHNPLSTDSLSLLCGTLSTSTTLTALSLDYCQLFSECGGHIGKMAASNSLQELSLKGNQLQSQGAVDLFSSLLAVCEKGERLPCLTKIFLVDNAIDMQGPTGAAGSITCARRVRQLLTKDPLVQEINLGANLIGESAALEILEGLKQRKEAGLSEVCVSVTHRITHETFKGIMDLSGLLGKKKAKGKKGGKKKKK